MNNVDPDIIHALRMLAADGESKRALGLKAKYEKRTEQQFDTTLQLLVDEVARVVPRNHPMFDLVLILAVARKIEKKDVREFRKITFETEIVPTGRLQPPFASAEMITEPHPQACLGDCNEQH